MHTTSKALVVTFSAFLLLLSTLILLLDVIAPYQEVRAHLDTIAISGSCDRFTLFLYNSLVFQARILGAAAVALAVTIFVCRVKLALAIEGLGSALRSDVSHLVDSVYQLRHDRLHFTALLGLIILGLALRLNFICQPVRYDEAYTFLAYASKPLYVPITVYANPNNHVLHTILVNFSYRVFGQQIWAIRLPALLAGLSIIPATYVAGRALFDKNTALLSAGLVTSSSWLIEFSTNARGYTLLSLSSLLLFSMAPLLLRTTAILPWCMFTVISSLGFYTIPTMLYPYGTIIVWLCFSCSIGNPELARRPAFVRALVISMLVTVICTILLYLPICVVSGWRSIAANSYVLPISWVELLDKLRIMAFDTWALWNRDVPVVLSGLFLLGVFSSLFFSCMTSRTQVKVALAAAIFCGSMIVVQRVAPPPRVWIFLLPLYLILASSGYGAAINRVAMYSLTKANCMLLFATAASSLCLGAYSISSDSISHSNESGAFRNGEEIALDLKPLLSSEDRIIANCPADGVMIYYFTKHNMPLQTFKKDFGEARRLFVVVESTNVKEQTVELALREKSGGSELPCFSIGMIRRYSEATVYEVHTASNRAGRRCKQTATTTGGESCSARCCTAELGFKRLVATPFASDQYVPIARHMLIR